MIALVAAARVLEERLRTSRALRTLSRRALYVLSRVSPEAKDFVRIRLRRIV